MWIRAADVMFLWEEVENRGGREGDGDFVLMECVICSSKSCASFNIKTHKKH